MIGRVTLCAAALISSAAPAQTAPKQPTGKWVVEFADHDCILSRPYGTTAKGTLILSLRKMPMETGIALLVIKYGGHHEMTGGKAELDFGTGEPLETHFGAYSTTSDLRMIWIGVTDESYRGATKSGVVRVSAPREVREAFAVPGLGPALKLLDQCAMNLGELWGIPKEQQLRVSKPAKLTNPEGLFSSSDYPTSALRKDVTGKTVLRLMVDEAGKPTDCVILKPSGDKALDNRSCGVLMHRAQYEPAQDLEGKPMRSLAVTAINWILAN